MGALAELAGDPRWRVVGDDDDDEADDDADRGVDLLAVWAGALLFVAYGVALAALGARSTVRRDIT